MKKTLFFICFALAALITQAQIDTTAGPHKGHLERYGNYRFEVLGCNDYLEIYIYDNKMQPVHNYGVVGDVKFFFPDEVYSSVPMAYYGTDGFTAKIPSNDFFYYRITATVGGQPITAKFNNECSQSVRK